MRVLLVPNIFFPDPPGGTEVGVLALAKALRRGGIQSIVAAPHWAGEFIEHYEWEGVPVWRYQVPVDAMNLGALDIEDPEQSRQFELLLKKTGAEVLSLHAWTAAVGVNQITASRRLGSPVVVTCHLANITCPRGSGMRWGRIPCDLVFNPVRCPACIVQLKGIPMPMAYLASYLSLGFRANGEKVGANQLLRGLRLAAKVRTLRINRMNLYRFVDEFVVQNRWYAPVLRKNCIPEEKIKLAPVCLYRQPINRPPQTKVLNRNGKVVVGFMGRLSRAKGVDLFVKAVRGMPTDGRLEVRIHGIVQSEEERLFQREIRRMAASDARICFLDPLPGDHVLSALSQWDVLCVPSRVQDMRPQVILEAFSVGVPVIGAALGGIPDLIEDGHNGLLFPPNDAEALRKLLLKVTREPSLLQGLRLMIPRVQTIELLASFMADRYLSVRSKYNRQSS